MSKLHFLSSVLGLAMCHPASHAQAQTPKLDSTTVSVITPAQLFQQLQNPPPDTLYLYNFWATWCGPCVAEMPHFQEVVRHYQTTHPVRLIFVSLDKSTAINTRVAPLLRQKKHHHFGMAARWPTQRLHQQHIAPVVRCHTRHPVCTRRQPTPVPILRTRIQRNTTPPTVGIIFVNNLHHQHTPPLPA